MRDEKHADINKYLAERFPGCNIEQKYDFYRGAQTYKVHISDNTFLLKVGDEFIDDNGTPEILRLFNLWGLAEVLGKEKELGVLVSQRGLETFRRG
ncbi:MAG TPA: hypothetical protein VFQ98_06150 [Gallionella sp.]|nr:hypothetical protein [Gallionella sp.]